MTYTYTKEETVQLLYTVMDRLDIIIGTVVHAGGLDQEHVKTIVKTTAELLHKYGANTGEELLVAASLTMGYLDSALQSLGASSWIEAMGKSPTT